MNKPVKTEPRGGQAIVRRAARIVEACVTRNPLAASDLPALIKAIHASLSGLRQPTPPAAGASDSVHKSVTPGTPDAGARIQ